MAVGLAMDAFAVSVADGARAPQLRLSRAFLLALTFGLFQALMPLIGWAVGLGFKDLISSADHWIAFGLLGLVGGKMIYADLRGKAEVEPEPLPQTGAMTLLVLAVATSIDALAVGFSLTFVESILLPVSAIGLVTFSLCLAGVHLGHRYSRLSKGRVQMIGGAILIVIGVKILVEHLS
ncbi:MAG TPA: manganese efflux pump MntP family protein [Pyrinomonadaceae bacterium]|nr:manganese efflux pump MntP family protein [Pyrinomonadaceae bacterium]